MLTGSCFCPEGSYVEARFLLQASLVLFGHTKLEPGSQGTFPKDLKFWGIPEELHSNPAIRLMQSTQEDSHINTAEGL